MKRLTLDPGDVILVRDALTVYQAEIVRTAAWAETQHVSPNLVTLLKDAAGKVADFLDRLK